MRDIETDIQREEKTRNQLIIQRQLGTALRTCLDETLEARLPERLWRLLLELDVRAEVNGNPSDERSGRAFGDPMGRR